MPEPPAAARQRRGHPARDRGAADDGRGRAPLSTRPDGFPERDTAGARLASAILIAVSAAAALSLAWTFVRRLPYPYDLEWMEGAMLLHAARLRDGLPLYGPPSLSFVPFAYPPLQPALVALLSGPFGLEYATARALSVAAYLIALGCAYAFLRETATPRALAMGGLAVSVAAFAPTGAWYDLVRIDSVWLALTMAGLWAAWRARVSTRAAVVGGALLTAALLAKQTAAPFLLIAAVGLVAADWRRALAFTLTAGTLIAITIAVLQRATGGWFWTYTFGLHQRHDFDPYLGYVLAPVRVVLILGPALALVPWALARRETRDGALLATLLAFAAAMVATIRGAGPPWGYANAFVPAAFFGGVLLAAAAARVRGRAAAVFAPSLLAMSVAGAPGGLVWAADHLRPTAGIALPVGYDPRAFVPSDDDRRRGDALVARLRAQPGRVFVPFHPFYARRAGKEASLHAQNLADINAIPGLGTPRDLVEAIRTRALALIVVDVEGEGEEAEHEALAQFPRLAGNYEIAERIDGPRVMSGAPVRPRLVLVPRP